MSIGYLEQEFENAMLALLANEGWTCTHGDEIHRQYTDALIGDDLLNFLRGQYPDLSFNELGRVINALTGTRSDNDYLSLRETASLCVNGFVFSRDNSSLPDMEISFIDFENTRNNIFRAVNQFTYRGQEERRPDILLFVNGIPLCIVELKNPAVNNATIYDAWEQIHVRYKRDISRLLKYCVLSCISDGGSTRLGTTCTPYEHYYAWKKVENEENAAQGMGELQSLVRGALAPSRLLEIVRDFVYFPDVQEGALAEMEIVCRYPQFFAVRKLFANILEHLTSGGGDGKGGTYFGATGCGKTYTMLFLARCLLRRTELSPTLLIIVDRDDLEAQAGKLFEASTDFLGDASIRCFESRKDLCEELTARESGGVFVTTVQKFCETTGLLSERANIICFSDEAHRTQLNLGTSLEISDGKNGKEPGAYVTMGFAQYLRDALPNATYVGFTGTPIEETVQVFGPIVDKYTMRQAVEDGITVPLKYEARLARVVLDGDKAKEIENYYESCAADGTDEETINRSRHAMSRLEVILGDEDRLERMAKDIVKHYESYVAEHEGIVSKAMIASSNRKIAYRLYLKLKAIRPEWFVPRRVPDESIFDTPEKLAELESYQELPMVNLVATRESNDEKEMYNLLGDKSRRQMLDREFKKPQSNFRIAIIVDMWITGFDVPCLAILYNDKPLQRHSLVQTISRVNRRYEGKEYGLIVDYIGIRENMKKALKQYAGDEEQEPDDIEATYEIFANEMQILRELLHGFDALGFLSEEPMRRYLTLQGAAEFVLSRPAEGEGSTFVTRFKEHVKRLKSAYGILQPSGRLNKDETTWAQFFMAVQSILDKTTNSRHSIQTMNRHVEQMVSEALQCTGVETVLDAEGQEELFSQEFAQELENVHLPHTKFQLLVKLLKRAIRDYSKTNQLKARRFDELLREIVDEYNNRDKLTFTNKVATQTVDAIQEVVDEKVGKLTTKVQDLLQLLNKDRQEFKKLGISFEEKAFYDILVDQRDKHRFTYPDYQCIALSRKIKDLVENADVYADWLNNANLKAKLRSDLVVLLYHAGYPPEWNEEVFKKVMEQVENFKTCQGK